MVVFFVIYFVVCCTLFVVRGLLFVQCMFCLRCCLLFAIDFLVAYCRSVLFVVVR